MFKYLLLTTAIGMAMLTPALAQDTSGGATGTPVPPQPTAQEESAPAGAQPQAPMDTAQEQPVTPPPAEAIIAEEGSTDLRAEKLIGTTVYNTEGEEVGSVNDIVFDKDGKIVGVVLKVGGVLGMGGKSVGIKWTEVKMLPDTQLLQIGFTAEQLEVAPDFKTQDAIAAEKELESQQQTIPSSPTQ
jgi:sporulation protein YlmC with PRC-barrel domain